MNTPDRLTDAWHRLTHLAAQAPPTETAMPFGFATRVTANLKSQVSSLRSRETAWRIRERFTWGGAVIAAVITLGTLALNYDLLAGIWSGDTALAGSFLHAFSEP